jgi:tetratricopeptide (TPR) repeat protein
MKFFPALSAVLFGTAATIALIHSAAVALSPAQVETIARQVTVQIEGQSPGSGVIAAREGQTYYVLTVAHVVPSPDDYDVVTPDGQKHPVDYKLVRKLPNVDLALVAFNSSKNYQVATIGSSHQVRAGTIAYVSGFPISLSGHGRTDYRFSSGQIDAHASRSLANGYALAYYNKTFTGMSGSPIFDQEGKLIGIHGASKTRFTETLGVAPGTAQKLGLNLGIPIDTFLRLAPQVVTNFKLPTAFPINAPDAPTADDFFIKATVLGITGDKKAALAAFDQAIRLRPSYAAAFIARGNLQYDLNHLNSAIADLTEAIRLAPKYASAHIARGIMRYSLGDWQRSIADYTEAIRLDPKSSAAYNNRALSRAKLGDKQGAVADYTEAIRLDPKDTVAYYNRANTLVELGDQRGAIADYTEAIRLVPKYVSAYLNRGVARAKLGDQQGAITDYTEAIRLDPRDATAFYNRSNSRAELGDRQGAIADSTEAIRLDSRFAKAYISRGTTRAELGDQQGAIVDYTEAIRLDPKDTSAYNNRGLSLAQIGNLQGAAADFTRVIQLDPKHADAYNNRGAARMILGDRQGAIVDFQQAATLAQQQNNQQIYQKALRNLSRLGGRLR